MARQRSRQQHFCTGIKAKDMPAFLAMCERDAANTRANANRYRLAAHNAKRMPDRQTRAAHLFELMRDHAHPQMELPLC